jgi:uncharacterized protein YbjQ (UPF0145 family)
MPLIPCPKCSTNIWFDGPDSFAVCKSCNEEFQRSGGNIVVDQEAIATRKLEKKEQQEKKIDALKLSLDSVDISELASDEVALLAKNIILTTSFQVAKRDIENEIEIVTAECVYGMHMFKDLFAMFRDITGGRSKAIQNTLRDARKTVLTELRREALMIGADAVIAVDLDYSEISGDGKSMLFIVAS